MGEWPGAATVWAAANYNKVGAELGGLQSGHAFIVIQGKIAGLAKPSLWGYGFYSVGGHWFGSPGVFKPDARNSYTHHRDFTACPDTVALIKKKKTSDSSKKLTYSIYAASMDPNASEAMCASWTVQTLVYAGYGKQFSFEEGIVPEPYYLALSAGFNPA